MRFYFGGTRAFSKEKQGKIRVMSGKNEFLEKRRLEGIRGKFCNFISEKGCLEGTSEIFEKNKVQREKWPVPSNGPPLYFSVYFRFFRHFRSPVTSETSLSARTRRFPITGGERV